MSTLCTYDLRNGDLFVLSWAWVRQMRRGSISSELLMCGQYVVISSCGLMPRDNRCVYMAHVCYDVCCSECVGVAMMEERDDPRKQDPASPRLSTMNDEITKATSDHKRRQWREFVESIDHRTDSSKLWRTIKGIDGKSKQTADNEGLHRKIPHLTQADCQQFQPSVHHF